MVLVLCYVRSGFVIRNAFCHRAAVEAGVT
jgi:hypothetical protein